MWDEIGGVVRRSNTRCCRSFYVNRPDRCYYKEVRLTIVDYRNGDEVEDALIDSENLQIIDCLSENRPFILHQLPFRSPSRSGFLLLSYYDYRWVEDVHST